MWREWKTEWMKVRYRRIGLILLAFLGLIFLWMAWVVRDGHPEELADGYRWAVTNLAIMNTVFMPTMTAMLGSRLCDAELKGNTLKLLCTMERPGRLYDMKLLMGACYLFLYTVAELGLLVIFGKLFGFGQFLTARNFLYFWVENYLVSFAVLLLQQVLSFFFENQIFPLAAGLLGSFVGLFAWFLSGNVRRLFLWSYYSLLAYIQSDWNEETRIMSFHDTPLDWTALVTLIIVIILGYTAGKRLFVKRTPGCR